MNSLIVAGFVTLPNLDTGVLTTTGQSVPGLVPGNVPDGVVVTGQCSEANPVVSILFVHPDVVVITATGEDGKLWMPCNGLIGI